MLSRKRWGSFTSRHLLLGGELGLDALPEALGKLHVPEQHVHHLDAFGRQVRPEELPDLVGDLLASGFRVDVLDRVPAHHVAHGVAEVGDHQYLAVVAAHRLPDRGGPLRDHLVEQRRVQADDESLGGGHLGGLLDLLELDVPRRDGADHGELERDPLQYRLIGDGAESLGDPHLAVLDHHTARQQQHASQQDDRRIPSMHGPSLLSTPRRGT
jgi:hypothetical protein